MNAWIKRSETWPDPEGYVLLYWRPAMSPGKGYYEIGRLTHGFWHGQNNDPEEDDWNAPDYWMPLPEPPK